jgi:ribosome biogenesis GTPase
MQYEENGKVIRGVGGLFEVMLDAGTTPLSGRGVFARAKGNFRHAGLTPLPGDRGRLSFDDTAVANNESADASDGGGAVIAELLPRKNALIRPPMANLDILLITVAAAEPAPVPETVDKLISIAEFNGIEPVIVVTKSDLAPEAAEQLEALYRRAGFSAFRTGLGMQEGEAALLAYINENLRGRIAAFSGASGVGKSTMLNRLFPALALETGEISHRIERGKNTTRRVELYPLSTESDCGFLADTPGFTMLDFERFDFFEKEDLPHTFREFLPYVGECRFTKCSHTKEQGCAIVDAVRSGEIARSRHESFVSLFEVLKKKTKW